MRFQLPQFIETETTVVGPLTLKQFLWVVAGGAGVFALITVVGGALGFLLAVPVAALALALAFLKIGGVPLVNYASYFLSYLLSPKKYLYRVAQSKELQIPTQYKP